MFLDLWSLAILTGDLLELIVNHIESGTLSVSLPFILFVIVLGTISALAWRSTYIPDLPPVPRPPYVIQISGHQTVLNNNGVRNVNTLSDVRLLSNGADVETVFRRFPAPSQVTINLGSAGGIHNHHVNHLPSQVQSRTNNNPRVYPQPQQRVQIQQAGSSALLRLFRPDSVNTQLISNRSTGNPPPNLIVYHRVNVYHHHHHHPATDSNAAASSGSNQQSQSVPSSASTTSVDSFTQYATEDTSPRHPEVIQNQSPEGLEVPVEVSSTQDIQTEEEEITLDAELVEEQQTPLLSSQTTEGLRHREPSNIFRSESSNSDIHAPSSASGSMMGNDNHKQPEDDQSNRPQQPVHHVEEQRVADIQFTIKFLNDTQIQVTTQPGENIADFKRRHFATEMSENKTVRLIFNGRVLDNDTSTIRESGIFDQCVVHCLIVARSTMSSPTGSGGTQSQHQPGRRATGLLRAPEPGMFFVAFVGVFLIFLWFICFHFGQHLFTQSAVVSLTVLTAIFLIGLVAFYLPVHPNQ